MSAKRDTRASTTKGEHEAEDEDTCLSWGQGWSRWAAYQAEHGSGKIDDNYKDQELVKWARKQRRDYWRWKRGEDTYLGGDGFSMLSRFGFDWGKEESAPAKASNEKPPPAAKTDDSAKPPAKPSTQSDKKRSRRNIWDTDGAPNAKKAATQTSKKAVAASKKPAPSPSTKKSSPKKEAAKEAVQKKAKAASLKKSAAKEPTKAPAQGKAPSKGSAMKTRKAASKSSTPSPKKTSEEEDEETETEDEQEVYRRPTRKRKSVSEMTAAASGTMKRRKLPTRATATRAKTSSSAAKTATKKKAPTKGSEQTYTVMHRKLEDGRTVTKQYELRVLTRLIPEEDEPKARKQIMKEEKDGLLKCDEPLVKDEDAGAYQHLVTYNKMWEDRFLDFLVFKKCHGHAIVPKVYPKNRALSLWVCRVRRWYNTGDEKLSESRKRRLEAAGFVWDAKSDPSFWKVQQNSGQANAAWDEKFEELLAYKKKCGNCVVPKVFPENMGLSRWVAKNRKQYKAKQQGEYHTLDDDKERRLMEIGFVFNTKTQGVMREKNLQRYEGRWEHFFKRLKDFKKKHGHCACPRRYKEDQKLATWVMRQRNMWKKLKRGEHSYMSEARAKQLEDLGFIFKVNRKFRYPLYDKKAAAAVVAAAAKARAHDESDDDSDDEELEDDDSSESGGLEDEKEEADTEEDDRKPAAVERKVAPRRRSLRSSAGQVNVEPKDEDEDEDNHKPAAVESRNGTKESKKKANVNKNAVDDEELGKTNKEEKAVTKDSVPEKPSSEEKATLQKGVWKCKNCSKDEFEHYIEFCAHEAECTGLSELAMATDASLEI